MVTGKPAPDARMATGKPAPENARVKLPVFARGMRIGLFGGSFNPPHAGHSLVCELALKRAGLDRVWVMVTPGNPLKNRAALPPLAERLAAARKIFRHPRIELTGFEAELGAHYSYQTVDFLRRACPGVKFVWIMGADNLENFFRWRRWRDIARQLPILVIDRPGATHRAERGLAASWFSGRRRPESAAKTLAWRKPPALIVLHGPRSKLSSTQLRGEKS